MNIYNWKKPKNVLNWMGEGGVCVSEMVLVDQKSDGSQGKKVPERTVPWTVSINNNDHDVVSVTALKTKSRQSPGTRTLEPWRGFSHQIPHPGGPWHFCPDCWAEAKQGPSSDHKHFQGHNATPRAKWESERQGPGTACAGGQVLTEVTWRCRLRCHRGQAAGARQQTVSGLADAGPRNMGLPRLQGERRGVSAKSGP